MRDRSTERCEFCGGQAVAFQHGARVCGRCGTRRTLGDSPVILPRRSRRAAFISLLSSGLLLKLMMGSVALAAVTGLAAVSVLPSNNVAPGSSDSTVTESTMTDANTSGVEGPGDSVLTEGELDEIVIEARNQAESAGELADAAKDWANCVADFAQEHRGEGIHPQEICGDHPRPSEYGLGNENGNRGLGLSDHSEGNPGENRGNSADASGRDATEAALEPDNGSQKNDSKDKATEDEKTKNEKEDPDD